MQECIRVWYSCCHEYFIILMLKGKGKWQHKTLHFLLHSVLVALPLVSILHIISSWFPALTWFSAFNVRAHSPLKQRVQLLEAVDMQSDPALLFVLHAEVEPLSVSVGVGVDSHVKVILKLWHPDIPITILQWQGWDCRFKTGCWILYREGCEYLFSCQLIAPNPLPSKFACSYPMFWVWNFCKQPYRSIGNLLRTW